MEGKRIKLIALDMDGCLVKYLNEFQSSWAALLGAYGLEETVKEMIDKFYPEKGKDHEWAIKEAMLLEGKPVQQGIDGLFPIPYVPGAKEFLRESSERDRIKTGLITTGVDLVAKAIAKEFALDFVRCNYICRQNGFFTGTLDYNVALWGKIDVLLELLPKYGISLGSMAFFGDNNNDIEVLSCVGKPVAVNAKTKELKEIVKDRGGLIIPDFNDREKIWDYIGK